MHERSNTRVSGCGQKLGIIQLDQASRRGKAVGERGQIGEKGERGGENGWSDMGIGVSVYTYFQVGFLPEGNDQGLPGPDGGVTLQGEIILIELP